MNNTLNQSTTKRAINYQYTLQEWFQLRASKRNARRNYTFKKTPVRTSPTLQCISPKRVNLWMNCSMEIKTLDTYVYSEIQMQNGPKCIVCSNSYI